MVVAQGNSWRSQAEATLAQRIETWFQREARDLPWRRRRSAYGTLVSEAMLQQTQVARVCPAWKAFLRNFPSVTALATASEARVLEAWQGLGYYRRARNLQAAAKVIVVKYRGKIPSDRASLEELPGIGPYCAGAISSIAYGQREAIVDGNVARVMMRIHGRNVDGDSRSGKTWLWNRARDYVKESCDPGMANEGLMELGATVCTPLSPKCDKCPVRMMCATRAVGKQDQIPRPRRRATRSILHAHAILVSVNGRWALVRRGESGLWAGLFFPPTIESPIAISRATLGKRLGVDAKAFSVCGTFTFVATHRTVRFRVWSVDDATAKFLKTAHKGSWSWHAKGSVKKLSITSAMQRVFACGITPFVKSTPTITSGKSRGKRVPSMQS